MELSRLTKVQLREAWPHEASDFTNWLAEEENLQLLSDEIGIDISLLEIEASVGRYYVDILAEEETTGRKIVIENQLEATNHDHLGKLLTYASGFDAEIVVWIVKSVRDEHKQAVDWLNEHTDEKINIFAIEMELWKIGDSPYAPKFQLLSQPNDWAKAVKSAGGQSHLTETKLMQLEFWTQFRAFASARNTSLRLRKPSPQHWYDIAIGSSKVHVSLNMNTQSNEIRCELYISDSKELYFALEARREEVEQALNYDLEWMPLEGKKASAVRTTIPTELNPDSDWESSFEWFLNAAESFSGLFAPMLKSLT